MNLPSRSKIITESRLILWTITCCWESIATPCVKPYFTPSGSLPHPSTTSYVCEPLPKITCLLRLLGIVLVITHALSSDARCRVANEASSQAVSAGLYGLPRGSLRLATEYPQRSVDAW